MTIVILVGLFVAVVVGVIAITESQRRIPTQSAKHVRGRRVFGGTRQYLPLKVNQAGVMPIIFASSLLIFPSFIFNSLARATQAWRTDTWNFWSATAAFIQETADAFQKQSYIYTVFYIVLIYFFCYFWTAITFNPKDMAENLKDYGSFIPGYRPGRRTATRRARRPWHSFRRSAGRVLPLLPGDLPRPGALHARPAGSRGAVQSRA